MLELCGYYPMSINLIHDENSVNVKICIMLCNLFRLKCIKCVCLLQKELEGHNGGHCLIYLCRITHLVYRLCTE